MNRIKIIMILFLVSCKNDSNVITAPTITKYTLNICNVTWPNMPCFEPYLNIKITFPNKYFADDNESITIDNSKFYFINTSGVKSIPVFIEGEGTKSVSRTDNEYIIDIDLSGCNLNEITYYYYYYLKFCKLYYEENLVVSTIESFNVEIIPSYENNDASLVWIDGNVSE